MPCCCVALCHGRCLLRRLAHTSGAAAGNGQQFYKVALSIRSSGAQVRRQVDVASQARVGQRR
jgi:hypothetical protein